MGDAMEQTTLQAIQAHAVAEYPRECCGLVVATAAGEQYLPCRNTAETPSGHFRLPAEDFADAEDHRRWRRNKGRGAAAGRRRGTFAGKGMGAQRPTHRLPRLDRCRARFILATTQMEEAP